MPLTCAAIPETLLETELFGHEKGAFTGRHGAQAGRFERADGGTIFLDEIDDMPLDDAGQAAARAAGGRVSSASAASRRSSRSTCASSPRPRSTSRTRSQDGEFREDLYYRLNVVPDATCRRCASATATSRCSCEHFLRKFGRGRAYEVPSEVLAELCSYPWPGNVRELENAVERAIALAGGSTALSRDLLLEGALRRRRRGGTGADDTTPTSIRDAVRDAEKRAIRNALKSTSGHRANAAKLLGISRKNLWEKMKDYEID